MKKIGLYFSEYHGGYTEEDKKKNKKFVKNELDETNDEQIFICKTLDDVNNFLKNPEYHDLWIFTHDLKNYSRTKEFKSIKNNMISDEQKCHVMATFNRINA